MSKTLDKNQLVEWKEIRRSTLDRLTSEIETTCPEVVSTQSVFFLATKGLTRLIDETFSTAAEKERVIAQGAITLTLQELTTSAPSKADLMEHMVHLLTTRRVTGNVAKEVTKLVKSGKKEDVIAACNLLVKQDKL